jgi:hypothetical protein
MSANHPYGLRLIRREWGGWLPATGFDGPIKIAVVAQTEEKVVPNFKEVLES